MKRRVETETIALSKKTKQDPIGEVDVSLTSEKPLTAVDMYLAAIEERDKKSLAQEDFDESTHSNIVIKLFEMALKQFETDQNEEEPYLNCLHDFGVLVRVPEYLHKAKEHLELLLNKRPKDAMLWSKLGLIKLDMSRLVFTEASDYEDDDSQYQTITSEQKQFVDEGMDAFRKSLMLAGDEETNKELNMIASKALLNLALAEKRNHIEPSHVIYTLKQALSFCADHTINDLQRLAGTVHYHIASVKSHSEKTLDLEEASSNCKSAIKYLETVLEGEPTSVDYQMLGQACILLSSLEMTDDDAAIEAFDKGTLALQNALHLDPENENIRQQLIDMDVSL
ncbi:hypothetical protein EDD86DRAFT_197455 [Gorgonomyces haynaldii]|nr:hypothetical protein EDD86DRAFT_197455 [Gorgonomyces haynaldii]